MLGRAWFHIHRILGLLLEIVLRLPSSVLNTCLDFFVDLEVLRQVVNANLLAQIWTIAARRQHWLELLGVHLWPVGESLQLVLGHLLPPLLRAMISA